MSDSEIKGVLDELEQLMGKLRVNVSALQDILAPGMEVTGEQSSTA